MASRPSKAWLRRKWKSNVFGENARRYRDAFVRQGDVEARFIPLLLLVLAQAGALLHALILFQKGLLSVGMWWHILA